MLIVADKYIAPAHLLDSFNCPHCGTLAHQEWHRLGMSYALNNSNLSAYIDSAEVSQCFRCHGLAYWIDHKLVNPPASIAPLPSDDMPEDVAKIYSEARNTLNSSPRAAVALLRLAAETLMPHLHAEGRDLNAKIGFLVEKGLDVRIQEALDSLRVIGNHAVHPGLIVIEDDSAMAIKLFDLLNIIIDSTLTKDRKISEIHAIIPDREKKAIAYRDSKRRI